MSSLLKFFQSENYGFVHPAGLNPNFLKYAEASGTEEDVTLQYAVFAEVNMEAAHVGVSGSILKLCNQGDKIINCSACFVQCLHLSSPFPAYSGVELHLLNRSNVLKAETNLSSS